MKTNRYIEQYMKMTIHEDESKSKHREAMKALSWKSNLFTSKIHIMPEHSKYFNFRVNADNAILTVNEAKRLGKWLLEVTEGLGSPFKISKEILKRR